MKRTAALIICVCIAVFALCSCNETETFKASSFGSYVNLGDYKNITIDKNTDEYKDAFNKIHFSNVSAANAYNQVNEGEVKYGDVANIDYCGKIEGIAFEGGTDTGYDLTIGSGSFIEGFEEGLVGVKVGATVDLNLRFPDGYTNNAELSGKDCVFTVTVNYRKTPKEIKDCYSELGFKTEKEYVESIDKQCIENLLIKKFVNVCTYKSTPDVKNFKAVVLLNYYDLVCQNTYGKSIEEYLKGNGSDMNKFAEGIVGNLADNALESPDDIKNVKNSILGYYAVFDAEGLSFNEKEVLGNSTGYERCYKESVAVKEAALKALKKYVKVIEAK